MVPPQFAFKCKYRWQSKPNRSRESGYLTEKQAKHVYKMVELGTIININTIKQEIDQDWELRSDNTSGDINPYSELTPNNGER